MKKHAEDIKAILAILSVLLIGLMTGCSHDHGSHPLSPSSPSHVETLERTLYTTGPVLLNAETINGTIEVDGTAGSQVEIYIRKEVTAPSKSAAEDFAREVQVHIIENDESIRIYCEYPDPPDRVNVEVSYVIGCPRETSLELYATNGSCHVTGMSASVHAAVTNGYIDAYMAVLSNAVSFYTTNGYVNVAIPEGVAPLTAATTNGNVSLKLHDNFSGTLNASTTNGSIHCSYPVVVSHNMDPHTLNGKIGGGGSTPVILGTINGNIYFSKF